jgi:7-keto-8-aminopelargonate synthetase-like enzyme
MHEAQVSPLAMGPLAGKTVTGAPSARIRVDGREYINFFGAGYLALTNVPEIRQAVSDALQNGASFANQIPAALETQDPLFAEVERAGAIACGTEASVYFASGYLIGMVGVACWSDSHQLLILEDGAHYNLRTAALASNLPHRIFRKGNIDALTALLQTDVRNELRPLLLVDGVSASTGELSPLAAYGAILERYGGHLFVDESHAFGVLGERGRGAREYEGIEHISSIGTTLSKAVCAQGAIVGCSRAQAARLKKTVPLRGTSTGSPLSAVAASASLSYMAGHPEMRTQLEQTSAHLRRRLREIGLDVRDSPAPIVSFTFGDRQSMCELQWRMFDRGICIYHSTYLGAGPEGIIRCAVFRDHTSEDIETLVDTLSEML